MWPNSHTLSLAGNKKSFSAPGKNPGGWSPHLRAVARNKKKGGDFGMGEDIYQHNIFSPPPPPKEHPKGPSIVPIHKFLWLHSPAPELQLKGPWFKSPCNQLFFLLGGKKYIQCTIQRGKQEKKKKRKKERKKEKKKKRKKKGGTRYATLAKALHLHRRPPATG